MSLLMDFKVASDTEIGIFKPIVGITKKIENNLCGGNTIDVGLLGSNTNDVGILGGKTNDVGVPIPEVNALPQVLDDNNVGVAVGGTCDKGAQCGHLVDKDGMQTIHYLCDCQEGRGGKSCHYLSTNNVLAFNILADNFTSLTPIIFRVVLSTDVG